MDVQAEGVVVMVLFDKIESREILVAGNSDFSCQKRRIIKGLTRIILIILSVVIFNGFTSFYAWSHFKLFRNDCQNSVERVIVYPTVSFGVTGDK